MPPKRAKVNASRNAVACHECPICALPIQERSETDDGDEALLCEGACKSWFHRWCGGVTKSRYQSLSNSPQPFLCPACTAAKQDSLISDLQAMVKDLADEVRGLRATVAALESSATEQRARSTVWTTVPASGSKGKSKLGGTVQPKNPGHSSADPPGSAPTAAGSSNKPEGYRKKKWHSTKSLPVQQSSRSSKPPASGKDRQPISGVRRVWGTMRESSCRTVLGTLQRLTSVADSIEVRGKFKKVGEKTVRWWFLIRGEESILQSLESEWANVQNSTSWKLEKCYQPVPSAPESPDPTVPHESNLSPALPSRSHISAEETPEPDPPAGDTITLSGERTPPTHGGANSN